MVSEKGEIAFRQFLLSPIEEFPNDIRQFEWIELQLSYRMEVQQ